MVVKKHLVATSSRRIKWMPTKRVHESLCVTCGWSMTSPDYYNAVGMAKVHAERAGAVTS